VITLSNIDPAASAPVSVLVVASVVAEVVVSASVLAQPAKNSAAAEATATTDNDLIFTCPLSWRNISLNKTLSPTRPKWDARSQPTPKTGSHFI
jgi:hypothetical protein